MPAIAGDQHILFIMSVRSKERRYLHIPCYCNYLTCRKVTCCQWLSIEARLHLSGYINSKVSGCHKSLYGSWGNSIHRKWRVVHPVMLLSTKLGHHQQYCCKLQCFQQDSAICQHLTIQGKKSTVSLGIKLTQKTRTTPVSVKCLRLTFVCGFLKGKAFKSNCTLWPEKNH
jgi:hypothetical protein